MEKEINVEVAQRYTDSKQVKFIITSVDYKRNTFEVQFLNLVEMGFTHYGITDDLDLFKKLIREQYVWLVKK